MEAGKRTERERWVKNGSGERRQEGRVGGREGGTDLQGYGMGVGVG